MVCFRYVPTASRSWDEERLNQLNLALLEELCDTMINGSLCGLGGMTPFPVLSALNFFPEDFGSKPANKPAKAA